jgi:general secretion pathway protein K
MMVAQASLQQQRGVALITAILIVALVTVAAVAMASRQQLDIRRTGNLLEADQAYLYALAGETWAKQILVQDQAQSTVDTLTEDWATPLPPVPVEGGSVGGHIEDLQGHFNLNNLVDQQGQGSEEQRDALKTVLSEASRSNGEINISPFMANRILDWLDADLDAAADGAEDLEYLNLEVPYRTANQRVTSASELYTIAGLSPPEVKVLLPLLACLPQTTPVNINTAPPAVLMSLHKDITADIAADLLAQREQAPFDDVGKFVAMLNNDYKIELEAERLSVSSNYFLVVVDAAIGRSSTRLYSLLQRQGEKVVTLRRSIGTI